MGKRSISETKALGSELKLIRQFLLLCTLPVLLFEWWDRCPIFSCNWVIVLSNDSSRAPLRHRVRTASPFEYVCSCLQNVTFVKANTHLARCLIFKKCILLPYNHIPVTIRADNTYEGKTELFQGLQFSILRQKPWLKWKGVFEYSVPAQSLGP